MQAQQLQQHFVKIRNNRKFKAFVITIIIVSAILIGAKTYDIPAFAFDIILVLDWMITIFFLLEISIRFLGEERKRDFFKDGWNLFDSLIVFASLIPIQNSEIALLGRLIRIFRVLRLVSIVPEMRVLVNALVKALPQLFYVIVLMFIIFYIYGAAGSMFFSHVNPVLWNDVAVSMLTLFRVMTFEDWTDIMYETMESYPLSWIYYLTFIFITTFAFLNMVIGIVVNTLQREHEIQDEKACPGPVSEFEILSAKIDDLRQLLENSEIGRNPEPAPQKTTDSG